VKERARRLREACASRKSVWLQSLVGTRQRVLVEKQGFDHAENFAPVQLMPVRHPRESGDPAAFAAENSRKKLDSRFPGNDGEVVEVQISALEGDILIGAPA
jgi:threonylcarbamoyladenosine tRNA methylthiotransferase MtaB